MNYPFAAGEFRLYVNYCVQTSNQLNTPTRHAFQQHTVDLGHYKHISECVLRLQPMHVTNRDNENPA